MSLLPSLLRRFRWRMPLALGLGAAGALAGLWVIALVNRLIAGSAAPDAPTFAPIAMLLAAVFGFGAQAILTALSHRVVCEMRTATVKRLLDTDLELLQTIGAPGLYATLTRDIATVGQAFNRLPFVF